MKKILLIAGWLCLVSVGRGQNPAWTIPDNYLNLISGNSFSVPGLPSPATFCDNGQNPNQNNYVYDGYDGQLPDYSSNMMLNAQGEVEFFIVDGVIYDGEGHFINTLGAGQLSKGASETVIVPDPANCDRYYIIAARVVNYEKLANVYLLDMSLPNEMTCTGCDHYGALVLQSCPGSQSQNYELPVSCVESSIVPDDPSEGKVSNCFIAASDLQQGSFNWVFISNPMGIYRFKIDASGFNYDNYFIPFGITAFNNSKIRSEMELVELSNGGFRLAVPYEPGPTSQNNTYVWEYLFVADLNSSGNFISAVQFPMYHYNPGGVNSSAALKGIEFSENGSRIYVTHTTTPLQPNQMEYYDFGTQPVALQNFNISSSIDTRFSMLERTENDKIILANQNGLYQLPNSSTATGSSLVQMWPFSYAPTWEGNMGSDFHKMYMLPDQIDDMDYEAHFANTVACCLSSSVFETETFVASSGTWSPNTTQNGNQNPLQPNVSPDIYIKRELRIPAGTQVTINNMNLHFAPDARLVIENGSNGQQGGKLTLNNTLLTVDDRCSEDETWLGVEVWGNTNELQASLTSSTQGRLFVQSGSRIEHAQIGVLAGKRNVTLISQNGCPPLEIPQPFIFDYSRSGGIVRTNGAAFLGNQRGIFLLPYMASNGTNNLSQVFRTDFNWDGPLRDNLNPQAHVQLRQVKGVFVIGSSLRNSAPTQFPYYNLGTGILSYASQFYVQPQCSVITALCEPCPNEVRSSFENLRFGIRTLNPENLTFSCKRSDFSNCQYGIYVQQTQQERITENNFQIRQASYQTAGIALYNSATFRVEENDLAGIGSNAQALSYGILVHNSGTADNDIYLNRFDNLHIAGQSQGINALEETTNPFVMSGLNWTCNDFASEIDLADLTVVSGRIDFFQGHAIGHSSMAEAIKGSARNRFSLHGEPADDEHDVMVVGTQLQGLQYVGLNTPNYFADSYSPNWVTPLISSYNGVQATAQSNMCPSRCIGKISVLAELRGDYLNEIQHIETQLADPRLSGPDREHYEARLHITKERLALLESQMLSQILLSYETLPGLRTDLSNLGRMDLYNSIVATLGQDLSTGSNEPEFDDPEDFFSIDPQSSPRKTESFTGKSDLDFTLYPNPTGKQSTLSIRGEMPEGLQALVVDLTGRTLFTQLIENPSRTVLDLTGLEPGFYKLLLKEGAILKGSRSLVIVR